MKKNQIINITSLFLLLLFMGCNDVTDLKENKNNNNSFPGPVLSNTEYNIKYSLYAYDEYLEGIAFDAGDTITYNYNFPAVINVFLYDQADLVSHNNNLLNYKGNGVYINSGVTNGPDSIIFGNNQWNYFVVDGNSKIPDIRDSIKSPLSFGYISSPRVGALIDNDNNLNITWTPDNDNENVLITIISKDTDGEQITIQTDDNGTYTIPSSQLSLLPLGKTQIMLQRGRYKVKTISSGFDYLLANWSQHVVEVFIVD